MGTGYSVMILRNFLIPQLSLISHLIGNIILADNGFLIGLFFFLYFHFRIICMILQKDHILLACLEKILVAIDNEQSLTLCCDSIGFGCVTGCSGQSYDVIRSPNDVTVGSSAVQVESVSEQSESRWMQSLRHCMA